MIRNGIKLLFTPQRGVALFISILMSMSLAVIAIASMSRLSEAAHQTGKSLQDRKLIMFAESASNIVSAEIQDLIDGELDFGTVHYIHGPEGNASFKYYPRDITVNPGTSGRPTLFGYRATARLFASAGMTPPGLKTGEQIPTNGACYDITIDVVDIIDVTGNVNFDDQSKTTSFRYFLGKMKTVGVISCFQKG